MAFVVFGGPLATETFFLVGMAGNYVVEKGTAVGKGCGAMGTGIEGGVEFRVTVADVNAKSFGS